MKSTIFFIFMVILFSFTGFGYKVTTIYDNCIEPTTLYFKNNNAYILDTSIKYISEETTPDNNEIDSKYHICFGKKCANGTDNPVKVESNIIKLTGRMSKTTPKLLLGLFLDGGRSIEALIDEKRVWISPYQAESKFKFEDSNESVIFYKKELNSPVRKFKCPLAKQKEIYWDIKLLDL